MECDPFETYIDMDVLGISSFDKDLMCFDNQYKFLIRDCMWSGEDNDVVEDLLNYDKCSFDYSLRIKVSVRSVSTHKILFWIEYFLEISKNLT